jgi:hypothetical protein
MPRDHASLVGSKSAFEKVVPSPVNMEGRRAYDTDLTDAEWDRGNRCPRSTFLAPGLSLLWFWRWQGIWKRIHDTVRQWVRQAAGREGQPSGAVLESQSVRTSEQPGARGYDGAKSRAAQASLAREYAPHT